MEMKNTCIGNRVNGSVTAICNVRGGVALGGKNVIILFIDKQTAAEREQLKPPNWYLPSF